MTEKTLLEYYLQLAYPYTIYPQEVGSDCITVEHPDLPHCNATGETLEKALSKLGEAKREWIEKAFANSEEVPFPNTDPRSDDNKYKGRLLLRLPRPLHRSLALQAQKEEVSLNQYIVYLLSQRVTKEMMLEQIAKVIEEQYMSNKER